MRKWNEKAIRKYIDDVLNILETYDYPALVDGFRPDDIAKSVGNCCVFNYMNNISSRMCAIIVWSSTMNFQILSRTKH